MPYTGCVILGNCSAPLSWHSDRAVESLRDRGDVAKDTLPLCVSSCLVPWDFQSGCSWGKEAEEEEQREPGQAKAGRRGEKGGKGRRLQLKQLLETSWLCVSGPAEAPRTSQAKRTVEGALCHL